MLIQVSFAQTSDWQTLLKIVKEDIEIIKKAPLKDIEIQLRLFELYSEKHSLLAQGESQIKLEVFSKKRDKKDLKKFYTLKKKVLGQLLGLSSKLVNKISDPNILGKIYYFESLNHYISNDFEKFYKRIKKAEKYANNEKYTRQIFTKLGDYHFNNKEFKSAKKYYLKLLRLPQNKWATKHLYNLSWCYFQLEEYESALSTINKSYLYSQKKGYVDLREQIVDSTLLFNAVTNKVSLGIKFLKDKNHNSFRNLLKFLHYVFEHASKKNALLVTKAISKLKLNNQEKVILLTKEILIYRSLKQYRMLQEKINVFSKMKIRKTKEENLIKILVNDLRGYTGYLQTLLSSVDEKKQFKYARYITKNFDLITSLESKSHLENEYYKGETYFSLSKDLLAVGYYKKAILVYKKLKNKSSKNIKIIKNTFSSYFKALENLKRNKKYASLQKESFQSYLDVFPKGDKSKVIYTRLIDLMFTSKDESQLSFLIERFHSNHPSELRKQKNYYKQLINNFSSSKNIPELIKLRRGLLKSKVSFTKKEIFMITTIIYELKYEKAMTFVKSKNLKTKAVGLKYLRGLFNNPNCIKKIRTSSMVEILKLEYENTKFKQLSTDLRKFETFLTKNSAKKHYDKISFYTLKFCDYSLISSCLEHLKYLKRNFSYKFDDSLKNIHFRTLLFNANYQSALVYVKQNKSRKDFFIQALLAGDSKKVVKFLNTKNGIEFTKNIHDVLDVYIWTIFLNNKFKIDNKSVGKFDSILYVKNKLSVLNRSFQKLEKQLPKFKLLPPIPSKKEKYVTFKVFSSFLERLIKEFKSINELYATFVKRYPYEFSAYFVPKFILAYDEIIHKLTNYRPITNDPELKAAIKNEIKGIKEVFKVKRKEYKSINNGLIQKDNDFRGLDFFQIKFKPSFRLKEDTDKYLLWTI